MSVQYINTTASERIALHPRAVYRVVVERDGLTALSYLTGALRWRQVVEGMIDRSASPAGFPLGGGLDNLSNDDKVATVDYRAGSNPGSLTVGDLVQAIEDSTPYTRVVSITRRPPVPVGGDAVLGPERDAAQDAARDEYATNTWYAQLGDKLADVGKVTLGVTALVALAVLVYFVRDRK